MRIIFIILTLSISFGIMAQSPEKMTYQAVIRNSSEQLICNQMVGMQISILQDSASGIVVYTETQTPTTNINGLIVLEIGTGTTIDDFSLINWANGPYFINIKTDTAGETNYTIEGTTQMLSVPYALYANVSSSLFSVNNIIIDAADDININYGRQVVIGNEENPAIFINENGKIGIGNKDLDPDERKDIELGINKRLWGYSSEYHLDKSGVFNLQAFDSLSKPAIVWYSPEKNRQAAIVAHTWSRGHSKLHNHWSIETTNEKGELHTRMEFPLGQDWTTIETHSANFKIGDGGNLIATGHLWGYGTKKLGFGDKVWDSLGVFSDAKWEFYRSSSTAQMLIHQADGLKNAELLLKKGMDIWSISNRNSLQFIFNNNKVMTLLTNKNVGIGISNPTSKLHVDGDVKITKGHSYVTEGADFAEYFLCEKILR